MFPVPASGNLRDMQPLATSSRRAPSGLRSVIAGIAGSIAGAVTGALVACIAGLAAAHLVPAACAASALLGAAAGAMLALVPADLEPEAQRVSLPSAGPSQRAHLRWAPARRIRNDDQ
jgi:zinc transporter ZupT